MYTTEIMQERVRELRAEGQIAASGRGVHSAHGGMLRRLRRRARRTAR